MPSYSKQHKKTERVCRCKLEDTLPPKKIACEGDPVILVASTDFWLKPMIQWQVCANTNYPNRTTDECTWTDLVGENQVFLIFTAQLNQNGNLYRAVIRTKCKCSVTNATRLKILPSASLILDEGSFDFASGNAVQPEQFLWLNRFTPSFYPFILEEIQGYFSSTTEGFSTNVQVGDPIDLYIWENKSGNFDPAVGAVFRGSLSVQVKSLDEFNAYLLPSRMVFSGPGDILIGVVNRLPLDDPRYPNYFPASVDQDNSQFRSWIGFNYPMHIVPDPPTLPAPIWGLINSFVSPGNWMVRAIGCGGSQSPIPNPPTPPVILSSQPSGFTLTHP